MNWLYLILDVSKTLVIVLAVILLGYILARLVKIVVKLFLVRVLGIDEFLKRKNIQIFEPSFSEFFSNLIKNIVIVLFGLYSLQFTNYQPLINISSLIITGVAYISILVLILIISFVLIRAFIHPLIDSLIEDRSPTVKMFETQLKIAVEGLLLFIIAIITMGYLGILNETLLYISLIILGGVVFSISLAFGLAFSKILEEELRELFKK